MVYLNAKRGEVGGKGRRKGEGQRGMAVVCECVAVSVGVRARMDANKELERSTEYEQGEAYMKWKIMKVVETEAETENTI